jgi:tetratricopeptide (TPR) repeat protein
MNDVARRASALTEVGRADEAIALLQRELVGSPEDIELLDALAVAQLGVSAADALITSQRLIALHPDGHRGQLLAALASYDLDDVKAATRHAEATVAAAPWLPLGHALYAESVSRSGRKRKRALEAAERAIELAPDETVGYNAAGAVELHNGRWRRAERLFRKALELDPTDHTATLNLAVAQEGRGNIGSAFADTSTLLHLDPRDGHARDVLDGVAYTTLVHVAWVVLVILWITAGVKGI